MNKFVLLVVLLIAACAAQKELVPIDFVEIVDGGQTPMAPSAPMHARSLAMTVTTTLPATTTTTVPGLYTTSMGPADTPQRPVNTGLTCRVQTAFQKGYSFITYGAFCVYDAVNPCHTLPPNDPRREMPRPAPWNGPPSSITDTWGCKRWPSKEPRCHIEKVTTVWQRRSPTDHVIYAFHLDGWCEYLTPVLIGFIGPEELEVKPLVRLSDSNSVPASRHLHRAPAPLHSQATSTIP